MDQKKYYITTTLPYVNGKPHLGHAIEFFQADALARFHRLMGFDVLFNYGTDEYGLKIYRKAQEEGMEVQDFVDKYAKFYEENVKQDFYLSSNSFIRTSSQANIDASIEFWQRADKNGDIYKKKYSGLYCVGCESFKTDKDLVDGKCPDHQVEPEFTETENYFFRLSKYNDVLLKHYQDNSEAIVPKNRYNEMMHILEKDGLEDISISREITQVPWGVPVPGDKDQVMYVWFEALTSYVAALGFPSNTEKFDKWWPAVQLCGPDNTRFQSLIWQGMLASADLPFSKQVIVHSQITSLGQKMSKTIGNVIDPYDVIKKYSIDGLRYFLFAEAPSTQDLDVTWDRVAERYEADLANGIGNLVSRVFTLAHNKNISGNLEINDTSIQKKIKAVYQKTVQEYQNYKFDLVVKEINALVKYLDKFLNDNKPWEKESKNSVEVITDCLIGIKVIASLFYPLMPKTSEKILGYYAMENIEDQKIFEPEELLKAKFQYVEKLEALFPRV